MKAVEIAREPVFRGESLKEVVIRFLEAEGWHYQVVESGRVVRAGVRGERGTWTCYLRIDAERRTVVCHLLMDLNIPPESRPAVLEYLTRVNYNLPVGSFDMDVDSGEIRFKTGLETPAGELSVGMVRALALTGLHATERYFPGVLAVVHSGLRPDAALARVEAQSVTEEE